MGSPEDIVREIENLIDAKLEDLQSSSCDDSMAGCVALDNQRKARENLIKLFTPDNSVD